jgi:hypothetical protein
LVSDEGIRHYTAPELTRFPLWQLSANQGGQRRPLRAVTHLMPRRFEQQWTLDRQTNLRADVKKANVPATPAARNG